RGDGKEDWSEQVPSRSAERRKTRRVDLQKLRPGGDVVRIVAACVEAEVDPAAALEEVRRRWGYCHDMQQGHALRQHWLAQRLRENAAPDRLRARTFRGSLQPAPVAERAEIAVVGQRERRARPGERERSTVALREELLDLPARAPRLAR